MAGTRAPNEEPGRGRSTPTPTTKASPKARMSRREFAALTGVVLIAAACGSDSDSADSTSTTSPTLPPTTASTTTVPPPTTTTTLPATTTTTLAPTTAPTTTLPPTTTTPPTTGAPTTLPVPKAVPADPRAAEPVINLGSIQIPALDIDKPMFEGVTLTTLDRGPGHWPGTAMPGQVGNVVIGGHRTSHDKPFRYVDKLVPGDEVVFNTADGRFVYHVVSTEIVFPDAIHIIDQTPEFTATLFACTPPGSTRQRIVIHLALAA